MNKQTLKSSIKAYCLELMNEMNSLGGGDEGAYLTKQAGRKLKKQDITSPTGFELSPKNNYYSKFKFRLVKPTNKNSKQLWKEIKINNPIFKAKLNTGDENEILVHKKGIKWNNIPDKPFLPDFDNPEEVTWSLISFPNEKLNYKMWWNDDEIDFNPNLKETLHKRIKQTQMKLDEVNKLDQYLYKIEGKQDKEINELKNSLLKIHSQLKESFNKIK